ncbi:DIM6/NTAB family protein [Saccharomonospora marina XMU15]|uniref:DIM6/NTAB family protein n=2 Tax=Saccharomonospora TaxID=1851 RepID=H5XBW3_9PSEU|nr:DIM6/NTAB family protein [Saccharomonospora marina XMU15]
MLGEGRLVHLPREVEPASFREVMAQFATGVTVLTVGGEHGHGMTANAFASVSLNPPLALCCVARRARLHEAILSTRGYGISLLAAGQRRLARHFSDRSRPRGMTQFDGVSWTPGPRTGAPLLAGALGWLECDLVEVYPGGDHSIFLGQVLNSSRGPGREPLLFFTSDYHELTSPAKPA